MPPYHRPNSSGWSGPLSGFGPSPAFETAFWLIFLLAFGLIMYTIGRAISQYVQNSNTPPVEVPATIVAKRSETSGGGNDTPVSTSYYVTFELEGGERREWSVQSKLFGLLVEGDRGTLTYQGTWFKDFTRTVS